MSLANNISSRPCTAGSATDSASAVTDGQTPTQSFSLTQTQTPTATQSQPITRYFSRYL